MRPEAIGRVLRPLPIAFSLLCALLFALNVPTEAQEAVRIPKIGYLQAGFSPTATNLGNWACNFIPRR